ncbi:transposase [Streptomyces chartreusis]|uniref:transposase n=1 Tax=Streptomyces chartreusis TaxID=1969 RepID=UPI003684D578
MKTDPRPEVVLADKAYSSRAIREHLRRRDIRVVIPVPADQQGHRLRGGSRGGRPPAFDRDAYKQRNTVERCINRLHSIQLTRPHTHISKVPTHDHINDEPGQQSR